MRLFLALGLGIALLASPALAADKKGPPSCAAIDFRPVAQGMGDGEQEAGKQGAEADSHGRNRRGVRGGFSQTAKRGRGWKKIPPGNGVRQVT